MVSLIKWFLVLFALVGMARGEDTNLVLNGDFSRELEGWKASDHEGVCAVRMDPSVKWGDKKSVALIRENAAGNQAGFLESEPFEVKPGQIYLLEFCVKGRE